MSPSTAKVLPGSWCVGLSPPFSGLVSSLNQVITFIVISVSTGLTTNEKIFWTVPSVIH